MFFFYNGEKSIVFQPNSIEKAYLDVLGEDLESASKIFSSLDSPRARWGLVLVSILKGYLEIYPTYFEIRNFLEIDLDFLIKNEKISYVELLLGVSDLLVSVNQETYKYVARVLFENNIDILALKYLEKSKNIFFKDPELLFLFSKYYIKQKDFHLADYYLTECIKILPDYYPARKLKKELFRNLA